MEAITEIAAVTASQKNDREGMEQARDEHRALNEKVAAHGRAYARLYELYADARERGNDYIDLSEIYDYKDEAQLIADMREYGIEAFTFSPSWTQALESAWLFTQNGCTLEGMVEINDRCKVILSDEYEKRHALMFRVQEG